MRQVLTEIFEPHHYEDENGYRYWYDSYGQIRKKQNHKGDDVWFSSGNEDGIWQGYRYIEPGYVYAPYVPIANSSI